MRITPLFAAGALALASLTVVGVTTQTAHAAAADYAYALSGSSLLKFDVTTPGTVQTTAITGVNAGETLVGLDIRPVNGQLYTLGVNTTTGDATLYVLHEQTGVAGAVGTTGSISFTTNGTIDVDLPDPATVGYGFDVNPAADRVRVVAGSLNFRVNPNTGAGVDGDNTGLTSGNVMGTNPDGATNSGTTTVDGSAYTNNVPNNAGVTTLYALDGSSNSLFRQVPANVGTQVLVTTVKLGGSTLDFTAIGGFDIPTGVNAPASNSAVASGSAYAALKVGGTTRLYTIDLVSGAAATLGTIGTGSLPITGLAVQRDVDEGYPVVGLNADGTSLVRFSTATPGTTTTQALNLAGLAAGENRLAAISWRPLTGQLIGLGVNHTADHATLYVVDPQTGVVTSIGATGSVAWVESDGTTLFDLPNPAVRPYAMDVNPMVDRVRITAGADLNARANPNTGASVDGGGATGTNPDTATGRSLSAVAYTNGYSGAAATTVYALSAIPDQLLTLNPPNSGTLTNPLPITVGGPTIDIAALAGMDVPEDLPGTAYAALNVSGQPGFYAIDLATGAATSIGTMTGALRSIAVGQAGANRPVPPTTTPPTTTPPTTTPPTTTPASPATLTKVGKAVQKKKSIDTGQLLACPTAYASATCATTIKVTTSYKLKGKKKPKSVVIATATVSTAQGSATRLKVTLSKKGVTLLKQRKALAAKVAITAPTGAAAASQTTTLKLKLKKKKL